MLVPRTRFLISGFAALTQIAQAPRCCMVTSVWQKRSRLDRQVLLGHKAYKGVMELASKVRRATMVKMVLRASKDLEKQALRVTQVMMVFKDSKGH